MRRYEEREVSQPTAVRRVLTEATCDRCGKSARCMGFGATTWGHASRHVQGQGGDPPQEYDLCQPCSIAFDAWIETGP
jgi:hypothetical protein